MAEENPTPQAAGKYADIAVEKPADDRFGYQTYANALASPA